MKLIWNAPETKKTEKSFDEIILPDGIYDFEIVKSEFAPDRYQVRGSNKDGMSLKCWADTTYNGNRKRIFITIGIDRPYEINRLLRSCGASEVKNSQGYDGQLNAESITHSACKLKIKRYTSKVGKISNIIEDYLPAIPATKTSAPIADDSEIPF